MKNFIDWFISSSQDPSKISLFIKSAATFVVLLGFDSSVVDAAGNQIVNIIVGLGMIASACVSLYGLGRKVRLGRWSAVPSDLYSKD